MRHRCKVHHLARPQDQRKAMIRSMSTSLFIHDEIMTTLARAKALKEHADRIITLAKRGDIHAMRQVTKMIYNQPTGHMVMDEKQKKEHPETVLRRIFRTVGPRFTERKGGYVRVVQAHPRRGDAAPMALVQLVD